MEAIDLAEPERVILPYKARPHFEPLHSSTKRWFFLVAHRRAGKSVALVNHLIRAALQNTRREPPPRFAYIGPSFDQTKDLVWQYFKTYTGTIAGMQYLEGELTIRFPTGASIRLYGGGTSYERCRGLYLDGVVLDEFPLINPQAFTSVVRPCLADYGGFAVVSGTSNGQDHFYSLKLKAEADLAWQIFEIPITDTGTSALTEAEVDELRKDMSPDEFAREMLCSFEAPVGGAYYSEALNDLQSANRITKVSYDLSIGLISAWDLGIDDRTAIWVFQLAGREYHFLDYIESSGRKLDYYTSELTARASRAHCEYKAHLLPHDVEARELATGQSRRQVLTDLLPAPCLAVPKHAPADGIAVARSVLGVSWFDAVGCRRGLARLRGYRKGKTGQPVHDEYSDGADAFRTAAVGVPLVAGFGGGRSPERLRRRLRGLV